MTRKINLWNTPLLSPSTEAQDYAEKLRSRQTGRIRPTEKRKPIPQKPPEAPKEEENTPNLPLPPVEDLPLQQHDSDPLETSVAPQVEPEPYKRSSVLLGGKEDVMLCQLQSPKKKKNYSVKGPQQKE